jgi:calcium-dependent protein kinase
LYEDPQKDAFYIVSDLYLGGELYDEIEQGGAFAEADAALIMNQVLSCINYCHRKGICHRDLKPENILLADVDLHLEDIKIIDFGLAELFEDYSKAKFTDKVGSSYYIAPEVLKGKYGPKCDVWSCGVIAFILLCGEAPFDGDDDDAIMDAVLTGEYSFTDNPVWDDVSDDVKDFVQWLLVYDDSERPAAEEALRHPWLENARRISSLGCDEKDRTEATKYLSNLEKFHADTKLKQAVCAFIASQLILKHEKDVIDEIFRHMDQNCDGQVTKCELKQGFMELLGRNLTDDEVNDVFQRANYSFSGAIEYSEFVVASIELDETRIRATFNEFAKGEEVLTAGDLREALGMEKCSDEFVKKVMDQIDTDHDGYISFEEFKASMQQGTSPMVSSSGRFTFTATFADGNPRRRSSIASRSSIRRASHVHDIRYEGAGEEEAVITEMQESAAERRQNQNPDTIDAMLKLLQATVKQKIPRKIKTIRNSSLPHAISIGYARRPGRTRTFLATPGVQVCLRN